MQILPGKTGKFKGVAKLLQLNESKHVRPRPKQPPYCLQVWGKSSCGLQLSEKQMRSRSQARHKSANTTNLQLDMPIRWTASARRLTAQSPRKVLTTSCLIHAKLLLIQLCWPCLSSSNMMLGSVAAITVNPIWVWKASGGAQEALHCWGKESSAAETWRRGQRQPAGPAQCWPALLRC